MVSAPPKDKAYECGEYPEPVSRVGTYKTLPDGKKEYIKGGPVDSNMATYTDEQIEEIKTIAYNLGHVGGVVIGQDEGYIDGFTDGVFRGRNEVVKRFVGLGWLKRMFFSTDYLWEDFDGQNDELINKGEEND